MKKLSELVKIEAEAIQERINQKLPSCKTLWNATPEEVMERATQSVLREYDLTGLDGNQLTLLGSKRQPMYLAVIKGTDEKYGLKREFVDNPDKGRNGFTFTLQPNTLYAWKESKVEYYGYFDGQEMHVMTKEEMMDAAENGVQLEEVKEENVEVEVEEKTEETAEVTIEEVKEIEKVAIDFAKISELLETTAQKEIADKTGISQAAISKYKRGETALTKMSVENAAKLTELYDQMQLAKVNSDIKGLADISHESNFLGGWQSKYMQLVYNKADNKVWYEVFAGPVGSSFLQLHDDNDINLGFVADVVSPSEIATAVKRALNGEIYLWDWQMPNQFTNEDFI